MSLENNITLRPVTMEAIEASIKASEERLSHSFTRKIDESIQASEDRLSTKIGDSFDELARMTQKEFAVIGKRFNAIDKRFDTIDERFNLVDFKLVGLQNQLDNVYTNYTMRREHELLGGRVTKLERKLHLTHR